MDNRNAEHDHDASCPMRRDTKKPRIKIYII